MIEIHNPSFATISVARNLNREEQEQIGRKIEKYLLNECSIVCEVFVR